MKRCATSVVALALASSSLLPTWAHAETSNPSTGEARARQAFRQGNTLVEQAKYVEALEQFQTAYGIWNNPKIKLNIATTLRALTRNAEALDAYQHYLREASPDAERRREVEAICAELEAHVARVQLRIDAAVRRVSLDGQALERRSELSLFLDPGRHVVLAESARGEQLSSFDVAAGDAREILVDGPPAPSTAAPAAEDVPVPVDDAHTSDSAFGLTVRMDIDGRGRGVVGAAGVVYAFDSHWQIAGGGLLGKNPGAWAGIELLLLDGPLRPSVGLSAPAFFVDGLRVGVSGDVGVRWAIAKDTLFLSVRAALVHFPSVPEGYEQTLFIPSVGSELRL